MSTDQIGVVAGMLSTSLFVLSYLPMLVKAVRTKDLSSYSPGYLVLANVGNLIHSVYVATLPFGPIWFLHIFYTASSALMLCWYLRYHPRDAVASTGISTPRPPPAPTAQPTANGPPLPCPDWAIAASSTVCSAAGPRLTPVRPDLSPARSRAACGTRIIRSARASVRLHELLEAEAGDLPRMQADERLETSRYFLVVATW
jgi:uncharacterized protein with PQ loop repeat